MEINYLIDCIQNYGHFIIGLFVIMLLVAYMIYDFKNLKCPLCKKITKKYPIEFGEFHTCNKCGWEFVPTGMMPFYFEAKRLRKGLYEQTISKREHKKTS